VKRRAVVTGIGMVTPLGLRVEENWAKLTCGHSSIGPVTRFDASPFKTRIASEVKDFHPEDFMDRKIARRMDRFVQFALAAAKMALEDARYPVNGSGNDRLGVVIGTAMGGVEAFEKNSNLASQEKYREVSPFFLTTVLGNMAAGEVAIHHGATGPNYAPVAACAAGNIAIGHALRSIQRGESDAVIAGGAEAPIIRSLWAGLDVLRACSTHNEEPHRAIRPFDKNRDGFVTGEGSVLLVLEELGSALRRGCKIYGEILGFGSSCDAYHITSPSPDGAGGALSMKNAMSDANISPEDIDYINAHATATVLNDVSETLSIKNIFGERSYKIPISSTKSMVGHSWGASGALEAAVCLLTIQHQTIHPTINYTTPDPLCDLDYVPNKARKAKVEICLSNSFGFGGANATIILGKYKE